MKVLQRAVGPPPAELTAGREGRKEETGAGEERRRGLHLGSASSGPRAGVGGAVRERPQRPTKDGASPP